ncbi:MAG: hypothetical protein QNJ44_23065 [Rhodobacter sp.]|nr:hypothetical protein [Rhodobacter sp.]
MKTIIAAVLAILFVFSTPVAAQVPIDRNAVLGERPQIAIDRSVLEGLIGPSIGDVLIPRPKPPRSVHGYIRGVAPTRVSINGDATTQAVHVYLPDVVVFLRDTTTRRAVEDTRTDLNGAFYFPPVRPGQYQVCQFFAGFVAGCGKPFDLTDRHLHLEPLDIRPKREAGVIFGDLRQADGYIPRNLIEVANVNSFARITAELPPASNPKNGDPTLGQVKVNNYGRYMLAGLPMKTYLHVKATVEKEEMLRTIDVGALQPGLAHRFDIRLDNREPEIDTAIARSLADGTRLKAAAPGEVVELSLLVKDRNRDTVAVRWVVTAGGGEVADPEALNTKWQLGAGVGPQSVLAVAYDSRGGYDQTRLTISTTEQVIFGGQVLSNFGAPISDAIVTVNGKSAKTGPQGHFRLPVPNAERFVFAAERKGFGEIGQVYDDVVLSGRWRMDQATTERHDPTQDIVVKDRLHAERCQDTVKLNAEDFRELGLRGMPHISDRFGALHPIVDTDFHRRLKLGTFSLDDEKASRITGLETGRFTPEVAKDRVKGIPPEVAEALRFMRRDVKCGEGASVRISGGSLTREDGRELIGDVDVSITTVNTTARDSMPGDWSGQLAGGAAGYMESFGAATVNISDTAGNKVNLAPGQTAELTIPVPPHNLAMGAPPAQIPLLYYSPADGVWRQDGTADLDPTGTRYVAKVSHFSAVNTDLVKQNQACIRMYTADITGAFDVEVIAPLGAGSAPGIRHRTVPNTQPLNALYNLPSNTWVTIVVKQAGEIIGTYAHLTVPQTGDDPNNPSDNAPAYDYTDCTGGDPDANTLVLGVIQGPPNPGVDVFLKGFSYPALALDESFPAGASANLQVALAQVTQEYHDTIDPCGCRDTLDLFKDTNNFSAGAIVAKYANSADLGFGRNMNCRANNIVGGDADNVFEPLLGETADVVCYVTNYSAVGVADGNRFDDDADYQAIINEDPSFATVAMEYSAVEDATQCPVPQPGVNACTAGTIPTIGPKIMKFFTYAGDGADDGIDDVAALGVAGISDGDLVLTANLDGVAERPIPQLCMVCHGGQFQDFEDITVDGNTVSVPNFQDPVDPASAAFADLGSRYLPFDVESFTIVDAADPAFSKANQQAAFRDLNQMMVRGSDPGQPAIDMIDAVYAADPNVFDGTAHVPGWRNATGDPGLAEDPSVSQTYVDVVAQVCRGCHIAQVGTNISFDTAAGFIGRSNIDDLVCAALSMPHARVTYEKFWLSQNPHMPGLLNAFGATHMAADFTTFCENKPEVLPSGPLSYSDIASLFQGSGCLGCHDQSDPYGVVMNLEEGVPAGHSGYDDLVDVNSTIEVGEKRVSIDPPAPGSSQADESRLYRSVDTGQCGNGAGQATCMPLGGASLSAQEIQQIENWINDGAAN